MSKVAPDFDTSGENTRSTQSKIDQRKADHIKINLEKDVRSALTTGLENYHFVHEALPELDLEQIDTSLSLFGKRLAAPILISSMTGGTADAESINMRLAEAAQEMQIAMGVGSQRAAIENPEQAKTFQVRRVATDILLFANLGAVQLNYGYGIDQCRQAVDMIEADALILHLNPLQEAVQDAGDTNFAGLSKKIEETCKKLEVPVIAKEVGWGISERTAKLLADCGVAAIDVAGAGGTSWSQVEMYRAPDEFIRELAATFVGWGISTADSILNVKKAVPDMTVFASGGLKDGLDIAKCLALGATLGGMAGQFLKAAAISTKSAVQMMKLTKRQIEVTMFAAGTRALQELNARKLVDLETRSKKL
ncbi:MAG TPA: type 2 isopentenyl-diphosphate Delta-isomerase [Anaerolineales bacterium]|nr:type 2 isopentenyl-diphosphate Delta-isomerase [Anaerolineales bacterium]